MAAVLAAPLALAVRAQNAPPGQPPAPPPPAQAEQTPTFRADINFVRVDVIVSDKQGNPVHDLRQEDFEITEDGKPQAIQTFKLVNISENAGVGQDPPREVRNVIEEQSEAARDDVRLFAIFLDDYHVRLENSMRSREPIARFIENMLQPADMAGIMYPLWSINDVMLTRNRKSLAAAVRGFVGRKYDYTPRNLFEERYVHYVSTIEAERIRNEVTLSALKGLITRLGGLREGRKAIILISEGFTNSLPTQVQDPIASQPGSGGRSRLDPISPGPLQRRQDAQDFFDQSGLLSDLRLVYELANRYNTAIYAVDPRGLAPSEFDLSTAGSANVSLTKDRAMLDNTMDTLRVLADETDGRAIVNTNDMDKGLRQIIRDSSAYYLLGYTSTLGQPDGKFHKINVRIKRPGLQVRARPGYLALNAAEAERATAVRKPGPPAAVTQALGTLAVSSRRSLIRSWIGMSPGANGKTKITFLWSPTPAAPGMRAEPPSRVSLMAGGVNSDLYYRGASLAPGRVEFEVPPGPVDLEISVEGANKDVLDREMRKLSVPSLGLGLTMSTPEVFRGRTLPEWQKISADPAAVPAIEREFRRTERLLLRVGAQSSNGTPTITARMLNRDGVEMVPLPVTDAGFGGLSHVDAPLAALPVGDYLIEVTAKDGAEQTTTLVAIRVTP
ncbi:MAG TPA: VWA domain-containing protein [Vicinamibacterales bacterium]|nr:VWA domain-containing protein [Vicinamibacterales bacterium]